MSLSRILLGILFFIIFFYINITELSSIIILIFQIISLFVFIFAIITDALDGYFARKHNMITDFGKHLDPLSDSIFFILVFVTFLYLELMPWYFFIIIFLREAFMHLFLRPYFKRRKSSLSANIYGKIKTVFQSVFSIIVILGIILNQILIIINKNDLLNLFNDYFFKISYILFAIIAFLSLLSLMIYLIHFKKVFFNKQKLS
ncbi:MAG: CDP-diacylglycerol--glycerol-3-phosphate 3-phosphatidyltransferase [Spirochaetes bacterium]|nr:CDP-diacylglycerol--glycerol-3-phosphate 3-phosphatidyltransferase [Spirochaetota bacterium]